MENEIEELKDKLFMLYNPDKEGSNTEEEDTTPLQSVVKDPMSLEEKGEKESTDDDDLMVARSPDEPSETTCIENIDIISSTLKNANGGGNSRRTSNASIKYPPIGVYNLLQGRSLTKSLFSAFEAIDEQCNRHEACKSNQPPGDTSSYDSETITSVGEMNSLTNAMVEAEGSYMGSSGSASVNLMIKKNISSKSVTHTIGGYIYSNQRFVKNKINLKLHAVARRLLTEDPKEFIELYGLNFVSQITDGGTFMGFYSLSTRTQ
mmetsp:Transcript_39160/g.44660  ORF Transcript_39160/g.44660 Transcript_39160/m.44660 type:complete len:263 (+) Transcript_39160:276-1064(+)